MLLDSQHVFSDAQAITATANSTNTIDLGVGENGSGNPLKPKFVVNQAFNTLTSLTISIRTDDNDSFSSAKTVLSRVIPLADLVLGAHIDLGSLPEVTERYVQAQYTVTGTNPTLGQITGVLLPFGSFDHPLKK